MPKGGFISEKIKPVTLSVLESCMSEDVSQSVRQSVCPSVGQFVSQQNFKNL